MIESSKHKYEEFRPKIERYCKKVEGLLIDLLDDNNIQYHVVESRTKSVESFINKFQRTGKTYKDPMSEINDLVGLRVILYYKEDVERVCELINNEFKVFHEHSVDNLQNLKPNEFGYFSIHKVVELDSKRSKLSEWKRFKQFKIEIQIRTVLQHSWASISHILLYKKESDVPYILKRRLNRLVGLLELADDQFQELKIQQEKVVSSIGNSILKKEYDIDLNIISVKNFIESTDYKSTLNSVLDKYSRYSLKETSDDLEFSHIVSICKELKISSIKELNKLLNEEQKSIDGFFSHFYPFYGDEKNTIIVSTEHFLAVFLASIYLKNNDKSGLRFWSPQFWDEIKIAIMKLKNPLIGAKK